MGKRRKVNAIARLDTLRRFTGAPPNRSSIRKKNTRTMHPCSRKPKQPALIIRQEGNCVPVTKKEGALRRPPSRFTGAAQNTSLIEALEVNGFTNPWV